MPTVLSASSLVAGPVSGAIGISGQTLYSDLAGRGWSRLASCARDELRVKPRAGPHGHLQLLVRRWRQACEGIRAMSMRLQSPADAGLRGRVETVLDQFAWPRSMFLVTGIAWLVISLVVLRFRLASVVAVGVLMGVVFLGGWLSELLIASIQSRGRWATVRLGVLFLFAACR